MRDSISANTLSRVIDVENVKITLKTTAHGDTIKLEGGGWNYDILLSDQSALYGFSTEKFKTESIKKSANPGSLFSHLGELIESHDPSIIKVSETKTSKVNTAIDIERTVFVCDLKIGAAAAINGIHVYKDDQFTNVVDYPELVSINDAHSIGSYVGVTGDMNAPQNWNEIKTNHLFIGSLTGEDNYANVWKWVPRLWCPLLGNAHYLFQGIYYGTVNGGGIWGPCGEIEAEFGTMLDYKGGDEPLGYAEILTSCTGCSGDSGDIDGDHLKAFFFYDLWEPPRQFDYYENQGKINSYHDYYTSAPSPEFSIYYDDIFTANELDILYWWSSPDFTRDDGETSPLQGIIAVSSSKEFVLHRNVNYISSLYQGENYIDHSVSFDGKFISIIYQGDSGTKLLIYDMVNKEEFYNKTLIIDKDDFFSVGMVTQKLEEPTSYNVPDSKETMDVPDSRLKPFEASMLGFTHPWPPGEGSRASGWKIAVEKINDKYVGIGFFFLDDCWEDLSYTMYHNEEINQFDSENLVLAGGPNGRHGTIGGLNADGIPYAGGSSPSGPGENIRRSDTSFYVDLYGCLTVSKNARTPIEYSGDVAEGEFFGSECWRIDWACALKFIDDEPYQLAQITMTDECMSVDQDFTREAQWLTTVSECRDESAFGGDWCFPGGDYHDCTWRYSGTSRHTVTQWIPMGSTCDDNWRVDQDLSC